jgi:hypothetical protein
VSGHRVAAITRRLLQQFRHDRRTLALLFVAPLVILGLLGYLIRGASTAPNVGIANQDHPTEEHWDRNRASLADLGVRLRRRRSGNCAERCRRRHLGCVVPAMTRAASDQKADEQHQADGSHVSHSGTDSTRPEVVTPRAPGTTRASKR